jgi:hypothetical protein
MAAASPNDTNAVMLADFSEADAAQWNRRSAECVSFTVSAARDDVGVVAGVLGATNSEAGLNASLPALRAGGNELRFSCAPEARPAPRVKVTFFTFGEEL